MPILSPCSASQGCLLGKKMMNNGNISFKFSSSINVSYCNISDIKHFSMEKLFQLQSLDMSHNLLTRVPHQIFSFTPSLVSLSLKGNPISTVNTGDFSSLHMLKELAISFCKITKLSADFLAGNLQTEVLNLQGNQLTNINHQI